MMMADGWKFFLDERKKFTSNQLARLYRFSFWLWCLSIIGYTNILDRIFQLIRKYKTQIKCEMFKWAPEVKCRNPSRRTNRLDRNRVQGQCRLAPDLRKAKAMHLYICSTYQSLHHVTENAGKQKPEESLANVICCGYSVFLWKFKNLLLPLMIFWTAIPRPLDHHWTYICFLI